MMNSKDISIECLEPSGTSTTERFAKIVNGLSIPENLV